MAYKRKRVYAPRRGMVKRRRNFKRKGYRRSRSTAQVGNTRPIPTGFRSRRISRRAYKRLLWQSTIIKTKYKSIKAVSGTVSTPATVSQSATVGTYALGSSNSYEPFWTVNGGVQSISGAIANIADPTETAPTFNSDIIIRGGMVTMEVYNKTETDDSGVNDIVKCRVVLIRTGADWNNSNAEAAINTFYSPGAGGDFKRLVGTVKVDRLFDIKDGESCSVTYRIPCQKIDVGNYMNETGGVYVWYISVQNGFGGTAQECYYRRSHNISFCGDVAS